MARSRSPERVVALVAVGLLCVLGATTGLPVQPPLTERAAAGVLGADQPVITRTAAPAGPAAVDTPVRHQRPAALREARDFSTAFAEVAASVTPAVVRIQTERGVLSPQQDLSDRMRDMFAPPQGQPPAPFTPDVAGGSGLLVTSDGLILTNHHVVAGADRILVTLWDKRVFEATLVGADPTTDVALIVVSQSGLPAARLGDSDLVRVGEWVLAIGNPGFHDDNTLDFTVTGGILSAKGRPLDIIRQELEADRNPAAAYAIEDFLQTDAAINPGNSGGPLIDLDGAVIGITTAIASLTGFNQGYGFAIPINVVKRVMQDLIEHGRVRRPLLGISIQNVSPEDADVYGLPRIAGVLVEDFQPNSPAERAGLRRHDVIVALDGEPVDRLGQFQRLIARHAPGEYVDVDVIRYGAPHRFRVQLSEANLGIRSVTRTSERRRPVGAGLEVTNLTPSLARERGFSRSGGALIVAVDPAGPAFRKRVPRNALIRSINQAPIESADQAERLLRSARSGSVVSLTLEDASGATFIRNIRIP